MIVVIGQPNASSTSPGGVAGGATAAIALAAAAAGSSVQLVGRVPDSPGGDALLLSLAAGGVGHVATLRQPPGGSDPVLQPADLELALRYLAEFGVVVVADGRDAGLLKVAVEAAAWTGAALIVVVPAGSPEPPDPPPGATILVAPAADPDGAFAAVVGRFAAALDRGEAAGPAFRASMGASGAWTAAPTD